MDQVVTARIVIDACTLERKKMKRFNGLLLLFVLGLVLALGRAPQVDAGLHNADEEVTYKVYWMSHKEFTGGCAVPGINDTPAGNVWYTEPDTMAKCPKTMLLTIPDGIAGALRAELYVDLWRNYDSKSARLRINNAPKIYQSPVGSDWSRTPWVQEIPLSELMSGGNTNTFLFWGESGKYHIHDVALRVYYDDAHPLAPGGGSDVAAPDGELLTVQSLDAGGLAIPAYDGGQLWADSNKIELTANVSADTAAVEFYAYYDGFDDDNDGQTRDWHGSSRNNWWPGGKPDQGETAPAAGGTMNHIGSVAVKPDGTVKEVKIKWDLPYVVNQSGVRFKIRVIDAAGNARDAAGGATPDYTLVRNYPVLSYTIPNFDDYGLHMSGSRPDAISYTLPLPTDLNLASYQKAYLIGNYWRTPKYSLNGSAQSSVRENWTGQGKNAEQWVTDAWSMGIRTMNVKNQLRAGDNALTFFYGGGTGNFIEYPGPMLILHGNPTGDDSLPPEVISISPAPDSTNVDIFSPVVARLSDTGVGVDKDSVTMFVNDVLVVPVMSGPSNNLTLTYTPSDPYPTESSIRVLVYGCDLLGNCMTSAKEYFFETEPPDVTPPVINNVLVNSTNTSAAVTWTTDEAATSKVEWGLTTSYEKTAVSDPALVTKHSLPLAGLTPNTTYNFRLTSTDYFGNTIVSGNLTFMTKRDPGSIRSDDFAGCRLDTSVWSYINPLNDAPLTLTGAGAQISVPAGTAHDLWRQGLQAPRLMQLVANEENFDVEVKFDSTITSKAQTMGILVLQDANNWLRFNFQNDGVDVNGARVNTLVVVSSVNNAGNASVVFSTPITIGATANYMRLNRAGSLWTVQYSTDDVNWIYATTYTRTLTMNGLGPYIGNTGNNPAFVGVIDYFENLASPLTGNDDSLPQLNITKIGLGTVTRVPDKANYNCNETVQLTAAPIDDVWEFAGWSGAINSASPTTSIVITQTANVVATFTNDTPYGVNVNVVSDGDGVGGTATIDPVQATYLYGDEIILTATPTPGWSFVGWSGSYTGTEPVAAVSVIGDMNITATFKEDQYTISATITNTVGIGEGGTITIAPLQPFYKYGDAVTLALTLNPGWSFDGWTGTGVSGMTPTLNLIMSQNVEAIANISQNQYDLNIEVINNGDGEGLGNGVIRTPEQETYGYGQEVTLVASPDLGWEFGGWGGVLSGMELTRTLEITQDNAITATFNEIHYELVVTSAGNGSVTVTPQKEYYVYGEVVTLTPVPEKGYEFMLWTGDKPGTEDPLTFAITQDVTLEAVFDVDTTPIEILSHSVEVHGGTVAVVSWTTDVPGSSRVDYGQTPGLYEEGTESKDELVTTHKITLTGLTPETFYHYQIGSVDEDGNPVLSEDLTFSTSAGSGLASDDFSSCQLNGRWKWIDPLGDGGTPTMVGSGVSISVPAGVAHNIWTTGIDVPRLMQASNNTDFAIEVKFDSTLVDGGAMQGITIEQDDKNFLRFNFYKRTSPAELVLHAYTFTELKDKQIGNNPRLPDTPAPMYMRIVREGNKWTQFYSFDGATWTQYVTFTHDITVKQVGVFAGNTGFQGNIPAHTAVVDYFFNTASPIEPEDSFYKVTTDSIEGSGKITLKPSKAGYYCGEEVTATAAGSPGWTFLEWTGDISGSLPTRTFTVTDHMDIGAHFQQGAATFRQLMPFVTKPYIP